MSFSDRLQHGLAATAVAAGVATFGWAVGGLAEVDSELSAAAPPAAAHPRFVTYDGAGGAAGYPAVTRHREHRWSHHYPGRAAWPHVDEPAEL